MKTLLIVVLALAVAGVCFAMCVLGGPPPAKHVVVDMPRDEATVESRILAPSERVPVALVQPKIGAAPPTGDTPSDLPALVGQLTEKIARLEHERAALVLMYNECTEGRYSVLGILYRLPEWKDMPPDQQRDVLGFLQQFPVKLSDGEAHFIATYVGTIGGDRLAEVIRFLGQRRVLDSLTLEQRAFLLERDADRYRDYFGDMR